MWFNILLLFIFGHIILQTNAVNMCRNETTVSKDVTLNLVRGNGSSGCICSVKLHNPEKIGSVKPKIIFETVQFSGCRYRLVVIYNNTEQRFSCSANQSIFHTINKTDEIKLYLEPTSSQDDTEFGVKITSNVTSPLIRLDCFQPDVDTLSPSTTSSSTSGSTPTSSKSTSEPTTDESSTTASMTQNTTHSISSNLTTYTPSMNIPTKSQNTTESISSDEKMVDKDKNETDLDIGLIGGSVGGALLLIFVIIGIIICIVSHRKKKNREKGDYNRPEPRVSEHGYTDINLPARENNSSPDGINNGPSTRGNPATPKQPDNTKNTNNDPNQMIIIENDLYVSSDDLFDSKPHNGNANNPEISNGPPEMEIIENDLYVSSDDVLNSQSNDDKVPVYAVVHKKPKPPTSVKDASSKDVAQNDQNTML